MLFSSSSVSVAPPEIFHRGGQMRTLKILGWHIISGYHYTVVVNWPVENYQKDLEIPTDTYWFIELYLMLPMVSCAHTNNSTANILSSTTIMFYCAMNI